MKTVSGKIVSTKPVTLSKAANILSNFVTSDYGASQSVSAYLRRASTAFNELVYFKKHHKLKKHRPKEEASIKLDIDPRNSKEDEVRVLDNGLVNRKFDLDPVEVKEKGTGKVEGKSRKGEKKKKKIEGRLGSEKNDDIPDKLEDTNVTVKEKNEEKTKKKKKRKNAEDEGGEIGNSVESERKKKRRRTETDD